MLAVTVGLTVLSLTQHFRANALGCEKHATQPAQIVKTDKVANIKLERSHQGLWHSASFPIFLDGIKPRGVFEIVTPKDELENKTVKVTGIQKYIDRSPPH